MAARLVLLAFVVAGQALITSAQAATFLERAQEYYDQNDLNAASVELKNALQRDPNNAGARFLLGKVNLRKGDAISAEKEFLRARELGYANEELDLMLAYARLGQGQFDTVLTEIDANRPSQSTLQRDIHVARGEALLGLGKFDEAEAVFDRVLQDGPHLRALVNKARIAMTLGNTDAARQLLDQAAAINPQDPFFAAADGRWYLQERRFEKAKERFGQAIELDPTKLEYYTGRIQSLLALGELDAAASDLEKLKAAAPDNLGVVLQDAIVQFFRGRNQEALNAAEIVLGAVKDQPQALLVAGSSAYNLAQYEKARFHLNSYLAQNPQDDRARILLGATMLRLGKPEEAYGTLTDVDPQQLPDNTEYLNMLSAAAFGKGDTAAGLKYMEALAAKNPGSAEIQEKLAVARQSNEDDTGASAALEQAIKLEPDRLSASARLFSLRLKQRQVDDALEVARAIQSRFPDKAVGDNLLGMAFLAKGDHDQARQAFESAVKKEPSSTEATINLANLLVIDNKPEEARSVLDDALKTNPGNLRALMLAADLATRAGDDARAEALWRQAIDTNPEEKQPRILLGNYYTRINRAADALKVAEPGLARNPKSLGLLETVGQARLQTGDTTGALEAFRTLASLVPDSYQAQGLLMRALELNGLIAEALGAADRTLVLDPKNAPARYAQVRYLAHLGRLDEARTKLQPLKAEFPDEVDLLLVEGRIALLEKRGDDALAAFRKAFEQERTNLMLLELSRALFATGKAEEALSMIDGWLAKHPDDVLTRSTLAETQIARGQLAEADSQYEEVLKLTPNNARALNNLAWIRMTLGKADEATVLARKALALAPNSPIVADTLGVILLETGENQEAFKLLQSARQAAADSKDIHFHFARALAANGKVEDAVSELRALLQDGKAFAERPQAEALLAELTK